jgi:hypothetical protein
VGSLLNALKGPLAGTLEAIDGILGKFIADPQKKLEATVELTKIQNELTETLAKMDVEWAKAQADVIQTEAKSESWITRNWRPIVALGFAFHVFVIVWTGGYINGRELDHAFVADMMSTLKLCLGGYFVGRSAEKTLPATAGKIAEIFANKTK